MQCILFFFLREQLNMKFYDFACLLYHCIYHCGSSLSCRSTTILSHFSHFSSLSVIILCTSVLCYNINRRFVLFLHSFLQLPRSPLNCQYLTVHLVVSFIFFFAAQHIKGHCKILKWPHSYCFWNDYPFIVYSVLLAQRTQTITLQQSSNTQKYPCKYSSENEILHQHHTRFKRKHNCYIKTDIYITPFNKTVIRQP